MKEDSKVGGSVTGLKDALGGLPELRFSPESLSYIEVPPEPEFNDIGLDPNDVVYDDDMTAGLPGLSIKPLGVLGGDS